MSQSIDCGLFSSFIIILILSFAVSLAFRERERESQVELERECVEEGCDSFLTWTSYMLVDNSSG